MFSADVMFGQVFLINFNWSKLLFVFVFLGEGYMYVVTFTNKGYVKLPICVSYISDVVAELRSCCI